MKNFIYAASIILISSCTKSTTTVNTPPSSRNKTTIELSSIYGRTGTLNFFDNWHITNNGLHTTINNDSCMSVLNIKNTDLNYTEGGGVVFNYERSYNTNRFTICDTSFLLDSNKVYSLITACKNVIPNSTQDFFIKIEETDFSSPASGFAKLRFIIAAPTTGRSETSKRNNEMIPNIELSNPQQTINLAADGRYSLDVLDNASLLNFITVPAGTYVQTPVMPSIPGLSFTLASGKKYTILVNRMIRTQYPTNDEMKLIEHSF